MSYHVCVKIESTLFLQNYSPNFYVLFHHGQSSYGPLSDPIISVMPYGDSTALARPDNFVWVWDDRGSGADNDVTIFRTICPSGRMIFTTVI